MRDLRLILVMAFARLLRVPVTPHQKYFIAVIDAERRATALKA